MEAHQPAVEHPVIIERQAQIHPAPAGQPPDLLPGRDAHRGRHLILEPDERRQRFRDDAGAAEPNSPRCVGAHDGRPLRIRLLWEELPRVPVEEPLVVRRVRVAHLQVHGRTRRGGYQLAEWRHRGH